MGVGKIVKDIVPGDVIDAGNDIIVTITASHAVEVGGLSSWRIEYEDGNGLTGANLLDPAEILMGVRDGEASSWKS